MDTDHKIPMIDETVKSSGDIFDNGTAQGNTSYLKTCLNVLNSLSGFGVLALPYALASGGWLSLICLFVLAGCTFFTALLLKRCMDSDPSIKSYSDIGQKAFGNIGRRIASTFLYSELYAVSTGFLILEGDHLHNQFPHFNLHPFSGRVIFIVMVAVIIFPTVLLRDLRILSYISATGVLASTVIITSVVCAGAFGVGFHNGGKVVNWSGVPTAFSLYTFCYCAHTVFPTIYTSMKVKAQFTKVLLPSFVLSTVSYIVMALSGYLMFGEKVDSQVTLNLPKHSIISKIAIYTTIAMPIPKYALILEPIVTAIEAQFHCTNCGLIILIRALVLLSNVLIASVFPSFADFISLVGAFLNATTSIFLPCICYLKISGTYKQRNIESFVIFGIIAIGIIFATLGTYTSVTQMIAHERGGRS